MKKKNTPQLPQNKSSNDRWDEFETKSTWGKENDT